MISWHNLILSTALVAVSGPAFGEDLLLGWPKELPPGSPRLAVEHYLEDRGIKPAILEDGATYTSRIPTPKRDYVFCSARLSSIIEGERVGGKRFNYWMSSLLATQKKYGDPIVHFDEFWRQVKFEWKLSNDSTLYFLVRGAGPETIIWQREIVHDPTSQPCRKSVD